MQALAFALIACMCLYVMLHRGAHDAMSRYAKRVLWVLLTMYLLTPVLAVFLGYMLAVTME